MSDPGLAVSCPDCPGREPFKNERALKMHRSKGKCRRHYQTLASSRTVQAAPVPSPSRKASPCAATSLGVVHAAASQPGRVQPAGLADQPEQPAAPQAGCQLQPVGLQVCPVTATFQLHPSLVRVSSGTQAAAVAGPQSELPWETRRLLHALAGVPTAAQDAVLKVVSSPSFDPNNVRFKRAAAADAYLDTVAEQVCGQLSPWQGVGLLSCARLWQRLCVCQCRTGKYCD